MTAPGNDDPYSCTFYEPDAHRFVNADHSAFFRANRPSLAQVSRADVKAALGVTTDAQVQAALYAYNPDDAGTCPAAQKTLVMLDAMALAIHGTAWDATYRYTEASIDAILNDRSGAFTTDGSGTEPTVANTQPVFGATDAAVTGYLAAHGAQLVAGSEAGLSDAGKAGAMVLGLIAGFNGDVVTQQGGVTPKVKKLTIKRAGL